MNTIGPYTMVQMIGTGASSTVWKATQNRSNFTVAIKVIPKENLSSPSKITRFTREIELLKRAEHPLIVDFYQHIEDEENHYVVMEYIPNGSLADYIQSNGPLTEQMTKRIFVQIFMVLSYLHQTVHIVHRDLKAENILLDKNMNIRIIDFGLSKSFEKDTAIFNTLCGSTCMYFYSKNAKTVQKYVKP